MDMGPKFFLSLTCLPAPLQNPVNPSDHIVKVSTFAVQCTKPQNFRVIASGKRNLSVSWEPPPYMGSQTPMLCYRIWYASTQGKNNEVSKTNFIKLLKC